MMKALRSWWRREDGSVAIEGIYGVLLLLGWMAIAFQFYSAFRLRAQALNASYTTADMISRERDSIGPKYVAGLKQIFDFVSRAPNANYTWLRVSIISCDADPKDMRNCDGPTKPFKLESSYTTATSGVAVHTQTSINQEAARIPLLGPGDTAVVVETSLMFFPVFNIGNQALRLDGQNWIQQGLSSGLRLSNFIVTRPRGPRTIWNPAK